MDGPKPKSGWSGRPSTCQRGAAAAAASPHLTCPRADAAAPPQLRHRSCATAAAPALPGARGAPPRNVLSCSGPGRLGSRLMGNRPVPHAPPAAKWDDVLRRQGRGGMASSNGGVGAGRHPQTAGPGWDGTLNKTQGQGGTASGRHPQTAGPGSSIRKRQGQSGTTSSNGRARAEQHPQTAGPGWDSILKRQGQGGTAS